MIGSFQTASTKLGLVNNTILPTIYLTIQKKTLMHGVNFQQLPHLREECALYFGTKKKILEEELTRWRSLGLNKLHIEQCYGC